MIAFSVRDCFTGGVLAPVSTAVSIGVIYLDVKQSLLLGKAEYQAAAE